LMSTSVRSGLVVVPMPVPVVSFTPSAPVPAAPVPNAPVSLRSEGDSAWLHAASTAHDMIAARTTGTFISLPLLWTDLDTRHQGEVQLARRGAVMHSPQGARDGRCNPTAVVRWRQPVIFSGPRWMSRDAPAPPVPGDAARNAWICRACR